MSFLSHMQRQSFFNDGFLVLEKFFSKQETGLIRKIHSKLWTEKPNGLIVDDLNTGLRNEISDLPDDRKNNRFKYSDLYLIYDEVRKLLTCNKNICGILKELMIDEPVLCNTLNLDYGSSQPMHVDALYMKPRSPYNLLAVWIALEDVHKEAGPLYYVPKSHLFEQYTFSNGDTKAIDDEMPNWNQFIQKQIDLWKLNKNLFYAKEGDIFIWHAYLCHGGSKVVDHELTRKSMVCHYFIKSDAETFFPVTKDEHGFWLKKPLLSS